MYIYDDHHFNRDGQRYECYIDTTHEVFPKTFEEWIRSVVMLIERKSILSGNVNVMDIDVTPEQISSWENGLLVQTAMPDLSPDEREFIMTGITPNEWEGM